MFEPLKFYCIRSSFKKHLCEACIKFRFVKQVLGSNKKSKLVNNILLLKLIKLRIALTKVCYKHLVLETKFKYLGNVWNSFQLSTTVMSSIVTGFYCLLIIPLNLISTDENIDGNIIWVYSCLREILPWPLMDWT